MFPPDLH